MELKPCFKRQMIVNDRTKWAIYTLGKLQLKFPIGVPGCQVLDTSTKVYIHIYITAKLRISIFQITQLLVVDEWLGFPSSPPQQWGPSQQSAGPQ